ncbi:MAG: V-type ATP synthase subunit K [Candidatus Lokiarchaeota archaeon]|nr:V-type ATP synthase subunit K [Candidatus Lokiarchaeota archaeon]
MNTKRKFGISILLLQILLVVLVYLTVDKFITPVAAQTTQTDSGTSMALAISAGLSIGLSAIGSGLALKTVATAAVSAITEREGAFGKILVLVALAETLAIYGLIVSILLWTKIP